MWNKKNKNSTDLVMDEGDFGVEIDIGIYGVSISPSDTIRITVCKEKNGDIVVQKEYTDIPDDDTISLAWTEEETALLTPGTYVYVLDWYRNGVFMYCIVNNSKLQVRDK